MGVLAVVLIALLVAFIFLTASVLLPVRFRFHGAFANGRASYRAGVRLPLIPWYMWLPDLAGRRRDAKTGSHSGKGRAATPSHQEGSPPQEAEPAEQGTWPESIRSQLVALQETFNTLKSHFPEIAGLASYLARSVTVLEFRVISSVGTGDAAETALLAGGLRAAAGIGLGILCRQGIRFKQRPGVKISPVYDRVCVSAEVYVLASIVPLRGIIAAVRLYRHLQKAKRHARGVVSNPTGWNTRA